jgi:bifunctional UDP-N-acetylglucosamine pyrophosphorylase/glucosamine-1-phosphate N-acetyltransferase
MSVPLSVTILAAGRGTRMKNGIAKALHPLAGRSLIGHVLTVAGELAPERIVVILAPGMPEVEAEVRRLRPEARILHQDPPQGTGHALMAAGAALPAEGTVLVLYSDTPLVTRETLSRLVAAREAAGAAVAVLGFVPPDRKGYGRLRFDGGRLVEIVEERHADESLKRDGICNSGVMAFDAARLDALLDRLPLRIDRQEYYLTDVVALAHAAGWACTAIEGPWEEGVGVNSQPQLAAVTQLFQARARARLSGEGVIMLAPDTVHLAADTMIEPGAVIEPYVVFGPGVRVARGAVLHSFSYLEGVEIGRDAQIGPFTRIRPGTAVEAGAKLGNFVEAKNTRIAKGAKVSHLSYVGDTVIGELANLGAGTITCNYDGFGKHRTEIGAGAFIGSNTALVAPVRIGEGAVVGAGSTIVHDVPDEALALARARQEMRQGAAPRLRAKLKARKEGR